MSQQVSVRLSLPPPNPNKKSGDGTIPTKKDLFITPRRRESSSQSLIPERTKPSQRFDQGRIELYPVQPILRQRKTSNPDLILRVQRYVVVSKAEAEQLNGAITRRRIGEGTVYYAPKWIEIGIVHSISEGIEDRGSWLFRISPETIELPTSASSFMRFVRYVKAYEAQDHKRRIFVSPTAQRTVVGAIFNSVYPRPTTQPSPVILLTKIPVTYLCIDGFKIPT
jgi:hypothetical protein